MSFINKGIMLYVFLVSLFFRTLDNSNVIEYRTYDSAWWIYLYDNRYAKYKMNGDLLLFRDRGIYQIDDTLITIIRTKTSTAFYEDYPDLDTIVIPYKDTITIDGLKYYKVGGTIKIPKYKPKKERKKKSKEK